MLDLIRSQGEPLPCSLAPTYRGRADRQADRRETGGRTRLKRQRAPPRPPPPPAPASLRSDFSPSSPPDFRITLMELYKSASPPLPPPSVAQSLCGGCGRPPLHITVDFPIDWGGRPPSLLLLLPSSPVSLARSCKPTCYATVMEGEGGRQSYDSSG